MAAGASHLIHFSSQVREVELYMCNLLIFHLMHKDIDHILNSCALCHYT